MKIEISRSTLALPDLLTPTSYWIGHLPFAFWLMEHFKPNTLIELGVHTGASYCAFCQAVESLNLSTKCYGIDSFVGDAHYGNYSDSVLTNLLAYHQPRYTAFSTIIQAEFSKALGNFMDGTIDLLHIDGTHFYQDVKRDFEEWLPKMSVNGIVLFHDTNVHMMDYGVHRFWQELLQSYRGFEFFHCNGLGVLFLGNEYPETIRTLLDSSEAEKNIIRDLFYTLGSRCQEKVISEVAQTECQRLSLQLEGQKNDNLETIERLNNALQAERSSHATIAEKMDHDRRSIERLNDALQSEKDLHATIVEQMHNDNRSSLCRQLTIMSECQAEVSEASTLGFPRAARDATSRSQTLLAELHLLHALNPADFAAFRAQAAWKLTLRMINRIRRQLILKRLVKRQIVKEAKTGAETAKQLIRTDPEAAALRYIESSKAVLGYLSKHRRTFWKRAFIRNSHVAALSEAIREAEHSAAAARRLSEPPQPSMLETKYPGITVPHAIANARVLKARMRTPKITWEDTDAIRPRMNFLLPDLDPAIVFGGYIAALEFAAAVSSKHAIRFVITSYPLLESGPLLEKFKSNPRIYRMLVEAEFTGLRNDDVLDVSKRDYFCSYSYWDGILAHSLAIACGQDRFISFCQEDESSFHSYDYCHATARYSQMLPQFTVFNTSILRNFFRENRLGVYHVSDSHGDSNSISFQHALVPTKPASIENYAARKIRRILFYARPEDYSKRNLFEFALLGIERFLSDNHIAIGEVEVVGVGTLKFNEEIPLATGHHLKIQPKLELGDYTTSLAAFDIGLSLMYAPHPSILPFEMAAAGLVVVTNTFGLRDETVLANISGNIVPVEPSIEAIAAGLAIAWQRCGDHESRIKNANFAWARDWTESFSPEIIDRLETVIREIIVQ